LSTEALLKSVLFAEAAESVCCQEFVDDKEKLTGCESASADCAVGELHSGSVLMTTQSSGCGLPSSNDRSADGQSNFGFSPLEETFWSISSKSTASSIDDR